MKKQVNYTVLGLVTVSLSVVLVAFFFWLATTSSGIDSYNTYELLTSESVGGLLPDNSVLYNGVKVGYVKSVSIDTQYLDRIKILIRVDKDIPITTSTVASLNSQGLTGSVNIGLRMKGKSRQRLVAKGNQRYPVIPVEKSLISKLTNMVPNVTENITKSMQGIQRVLDKENTDNVSSILNNVKKTTDNLSDEQKKITQQLTVTLKKIDQASESIQQAASNLNKAAASGTVVLDGVSQQTLPQVSNLVQQVTDASRTIRELSKQINHDPSVLVRGRKYTQLGPGEK